MTTPLARQSIPVSAFYEAGRESLALTLAAGSGGLKRHISEAAINRPGLALTGFFQYFAHRRVQVIGLAEYTYLSSLSQQERTARLSEFFRSRIPCVVVSRNKRVLPEIMEMGEAFRVPVFRTRLVTKVFVNAATLLTENLMAPHLKAQGTMVEIMGIGVLIEGPPGIGKSDTALGLIRKGYALIADDVTALRLDSGGSLIGAPVRVTRYHMEIRGVGIVHVPSLFGVASVRDEKRLDLVVTLCPAGDRSVEDRGGEERRVRELLGVPVPQICIAVTPGRDLAHVVEIAALDMKLKGLGHDAQKELDDTLVASMMEGKPGND